MKAKVDYAWVLFILIGIAIVFAWKPVSQFIKENSVRGSEEYAHGKEVFHNPTQWAGEDSYRSCAMCHDPGFSPQPGKTVEMEDYDPDNPVVLENINKRYRSGVLSSEDDLYNQITRCLTLQTRIGVGPISQNAEFFQDLMTYVRYQ